MSLIHLNRQVNTGSWKRCGCSVRTPPATTPSYTVISLDITSNMPMVDHLQLSKSQCEDGFQREEVWNPVLSAAVPRCPKQSGPTKWACDARRGANGGGGQRKEVVRHWRSPSTSHSDWLEALGGRCTQKKNKTKTVLENWEFARATCVSPRARAGDLAALTRRIRGTRSWNSDKDLLELHMVGYYKFSAVQIPLQLAF